jgi:hypothetical protein
MKFKVGDLVIVNSDPWGHEFKIVECHEDGYLGESTTSSKYKWFFPMIENDLVASNHDVDMELLSSIIDQIKKEGL